MNRDPRRPRRQPPGGHTVTTAAGRELSTFPAMVHGFVVDSYDRFLLFRRPGQAGWEVASSPLELGETVPKAVDRTMESAVGTAFLTVYLGVLDAFTVEFDANIPPLIALACLLRYRGGDLRPGKEHTDVEFRWWDLTDLDNIALAVPRDRWDLLTRAVDTSRYLRDVQPPEEDDRGDSFDFI